MATKSVKTSDLDIYITEACKTGAKEVTAKVLKATLSGEQNLSGSNVVYNPASNSSGAWGLAQMKDQALLSCGPRVLGYGPKENPPEQTYMDALHKAAAEPKTAIKLMKAYLDAEIPGIKGSLKGVKYDSNDIGAIVAGSYNLGASENKKAILASIANGRFNKDAYYQNYYNTLNPADRSQSNVNRVRKAGGDLPTNVPYTAKATNLMEIEKGRAANYIANVDFLSDTVSNGALSEMPSLIIEEGLDSKPWYDDRELTTGNRNLKLISTPAWFEINLKQDIKSSNRLKYNNDVVKVKLNVSLSEVQVSLAHVINNRHSRTGFHVTLWGQEPDTISASGSTGVFMNFFGLANLMSEEGVMNRSELEDAFLYDSDNNKNPANKANKGVYQRTVSLENQPLRIAAQEAFIEMLSLFKNNGITRFHPEIVNRIYPQNKQGNGGVVSGEASRTSAKEPMNPWSKAIGMSFTQATNRSNDVMTRGYVVFKYKNKTYLGYFKDINFEMDSNNPFRWNFNFTFQVERSLSTTFFLPNLSSGFDSNFG